MYKKNIKILITGASGTIGKFLTNKLKNHDVFTPTSKSVDFTNREHVDKLFNSHQYFDVVIHCAIKGGNRLYRDNWNVLDDNIKMYYNLLHNKNKFGKLINFGSGAEFFTHPHPYGLSKKVIAMSMLDHNNFYNIRIFGLFGEGELETRFIRSALTNYINKKPIEIHQHKVMDFFYMEDLWSVIKYYIATEHPPKEIDCCYENSRSLYTIAKQINSLGDYEVPINEEYCVEEFNYTGNQYYLLNLPIDLVGFENALKLEYEKYKLCN